MVDGAPVKLGTAHIWTKKAVWQRRRRRRSRQLRPNATGKMPWGKLPVVGIGADGKTPDAASPMIEKHVCGCLVVTGLGRIILVAGVLVTFPDVQCKLLNLHAETSADGTAKLDKKEPVNGTCGILRHLEPVNQSQSSRFACFIIVHCSIAALQCRDQTNEMYIDVLLATLYVLAQIFGLLIWSFFWSAFEVSEDGILSYSGRTFSMVPWPLAWLPHSYELSRCGSPCKELQNT